MWSADLEVSGGCFGWEVERYRDVDSKLSYAFTLAQSGSWDDYEKRKTFMDETLRAAGFNPVFQEMEKKTYTYKGADGEDIVRHLPEPADGSFIYVDHSGAFDDNFVERLFSDTEFFLDFVFGESEIATGNDNDEDDHPMTGMAGDYFTEKGN